MSKCSSSLSSMTCGSTAKILSPTSSKTSAQIVDTMILATCALLLLFCCKAPGSVGSGTDCVMYVVSPISIMHVVIANFHEI